MACVCNMKRSTIRCTDVDGFGLDVADEEVEPVEEGLDDDEHQQLKRADLADEGAERDEAGTGAEETVEHVLHTCHVETRSAFSISASPWGVRVAGQLYPHAGGG